MSPPKIRLRGAREHNLRGIDLDLPVGEHVVISGVSGSGKSSLAWDTLAREGMRRLLASIAASAPGRGEALARRAAAIPRPRFDRLDGLPAVIGVGQGDLAAGPRATLGTIAGVTAPLRGYFARHAEWSCPQCGTPRPMVSSAQLAARLLREKEGRAVRVLAPLRLEKGESLAAALAALPARGVLRAWMEGGTELRLDEAYEVPREPVVPYAVADRLVVRAEQAARLAEALERALDLGRGRAALEDAGEVSGYATSRGCPRCGIELPAPSPRLLSSGSAPGACETCEGEGGACAACGGSGLSPLARSARLGGFDFGEVEASGARELRGWLDRIDPPQSAASRELRAEIAERLAVLEDLGLGGVALRRRASTLSTGEARRARCAAAFGARIEGALFVLDEPTVGCHALDRLRLRGRIAELCRRGNTVVTVEHDLEIVRAADRVVELGPGAGAAGGTIVFEGTPAALARASTPTGRCLADRSVPPRAARPCTDGFVRVVGARGRNLRGVTATFPLGALTAVTGVSGSGKSSLVFGTLAAAARRALRGESTAAEPLLPHDEVTGLEAFERRVVVGPTLPARAARSTPSSILGVASELRELLAATPVAKARGWNASHFSANRSGWRSRESNGVLDGGRCEACAGRGFREIVPELLEPVTVPCEVCKGTRYAASTLEVRWHGRSIAELHELSLVDAAELLAPVPRIAAALAPAIELGLGYLRLGERADSLSGGELKRLRIARELAGTAGGGRALVLLDEPTRGLHGAEVRRLLAALRRLADRGDCVVVTEHDLETIRFADRVIDLGPGSGSEGGRLLGEGTPEEIAALDTPTGRALRGELDETPAAAAQRRRSQTRAIVVRGARAGRLAGRNAEIPHGKLTVVAGPAGSGKTTLALDLVAAEGHRRFLAALSAVERRLVERTEVPEVDAITGLGLTLTLRDLPPSFPWGEATGLLPLLRSLYAALAEAHCPRCDEPLRRREPSEVLGEAFERFSGARARVLAKTSMEWAADARARGFVRAWIGGAEVRLEDLESTKGAELVVDRLEIAESSRARLLEALEEAALAGDGRGALLLIDGTRLDFDRRGGCARCGERLERDLTAEDFAADPLGPYAAAARLGNMRWPRDGWSGASLARLLDATRGARPAGSAFVFEALEEKLRIARSFLEEEARLDDATPTAAARAAWIACCASAAPAGSTVVVDDPTRGLDESSARTLTAHLREIAGRGHTLLVASADPVVLEIADAKIVLGETKPEAARRSGAVLVVPIDPARAGEEEIARAAGRSASRLELGCGPEGAATTARTPVELLEILEPLAVLFARTPEARAEGFEPRRFEFTASGQGTGRCDLCKGRGAIPIALDFAPTEESLCPACGGARYEPRTLAVRLYGSTIAETLALSIGDAAARFAESPKIARALGEAAELGLASLPLARAARRISPSEKTRLELAAILARASREAAGVLAVGRVAEGLFGEDRRRVLDRLEALAAEGTSVVLFDPRERQRSSKAGAALRGRR